MKLVFIYGPPGVGKLTIAQSLADLTSFKVFHNNLTVSCVKSVFEFGTSSYTKIVEKIRLDIIEEAARKGVEGLIFTFVYANPEDNNFVGQVIEIIEKYGGQVCFVRLYCEKEELEQRVVSETRKSFDKLVDVQLLRARLARFDFLSVVPGRQSLSIDNTHVAADRVAEMIRIQYCL